MKQNYRRKKTQIKPNETSKRKRMQKSKTSRLWARRLSLLGSCVLVLTLLIFGFVFLLTKIFSIKNVIVEGDKIYSTEEIKICAGLDKPKSLLFFSSESAQEKLYNSLQNVDDAVITKHFPSTVKITISAAQPKYALKSNDEYFVVSSRHKFLAKTSDVPAEVIVVLGVGFDILASQKVAYSSEGLKNLFVKISDAFKSFDLNAVKQIDLTNTEDISINYDNRITLKLGGDENLEYKLSTIKEILLHKISASDRGTLDVSNLEKENRSYFYLDE